MCMNLIESFIFIFLIGAQHPTQSSPSTEKKPQVSCLVPHIHLPSSDNDRSSSSSSLSHHLVDDKPRGSQDSDHGNNNSHSPASRSSLSTNSPVARSDSDQDRTGPSSKDAAQHLNPLSGVTHPDRDPNTDPSSKSGEAEANTRLEELPLQQWPRKSSGSSTGDGTRQLHADDAVKQKPRDLDPISKTRQHPRVRRGARASNPNNLTSGGVAPNKTHRRTSKGSAANSSSDSDSNSPPNRKRTRRRQRHSPSKTPPLKLEDNTSLSSSREPSVSSEIPDAQVESAKRDSWDGRKSTDGSEKSKSGKGQIPDELV